MCVCNNDVLVLVVRSFNSATAYTAKLAPKTHRTIRMLFGIYLEKIMSSGATATIAFSHSYMRTHAQSIVHKDFIFEFTTVFHQIDRAIAEVV